MDNNQGSRKTLTPHKSQGSSDKNKNFTLCGWCLNDLGKDRGGVCGGCRIVFYCDRECQRNHWKQGGHKYECMEIVD